MSFKYGSNISDHDTPDEQEAWKDLQELRFTISNLKNTYFNNDDDDLAVKIKLRIVDELPDDAMIYSCNSKVGLIVRQGENEEGFRAEYSPTETAAGP